MQETVVRKMHNNVRAKYSTLIESYLKCTVLSEVRSHSLTCVMFNTAGKNNTETLWNNTTIYVCSRCLLIVILKKHDHSRTFWSNLSGNNA